MAESLTGVGQRVDALSRTVTEALDNVQRRNRVMLVVFLVLIVGMGAYLYYAHTQFATVNPDLAFGVGSVKAKEQMPEVFAELRRQGKAMAPDVVKQAAEALKTAPDQVHTMLKAGIDQQLKTHLPAVEQRVLEEVKRTLDTELAAQKARDKGTPEERFKQVIDALHDKTKEFIGTTMTTYVNESSEVLTHLERLAENKNLTEDEQLQREVLKTMMILWRQHAAQSAGNATTAPAR